MQGAWWTWSGLSEGPPSSSKPSTWGAVSWRQHLLSMIPTSGSCCYHLAGGAEAWSPIRSGSGIATFLWSTDSWTNPHILSQQQNSVDIHGLVFASSVFNFRFALMSCFLQSSFCLAKIYMQSMYCLCTIHVFVCLCACDALQAFHWFSSYLFLTILVQMTITSTVNPTWPDLTCSTFTTTTILTPVFGVENKNKPLNYQCLVPII